MIAYKVEGNKVTCILVDRRHGQNRKYYGTTVCSPDDQFNLEKGKRIALIRARLMELGENEVHDAKVLTYIRNRMTIIESKFAKKQSNITDTKIRLKAELKNAYEA